MQIFSKRRAVTLSVTLVMAACGIFAGHFLARGITAWVTEARLEGYASELMASGEDWAAEARTALAAVDASPSSSCSGAEIKYLRALILESEFLKDAGQMRGDGEIECSAALGRVNPPREQTEPDFTQQDGTAIYKNLKSYQDSAIPAIALQRGDAFVVFTPSARMYVQPAPMHFTQTVTDEPTQKHGSLIGEALPAEMPILTTERKLWAGDNLYVTRCSIRFFNCVTAYTTIPEIVAAHRARFRACIAVCGLFGALTGFLCSLLYRRNKSIEKQLRRAIRRDKLRVVYQPIVDLSSGHIVGAEALARWTDEEGNVIGPDVFVRAAEKYGFVGEITRLVLRHVLQELGPTLRARPDFRVSINATSADLADPGFLDLLGVSLAQAELSSQSLTIEITEGSTVQYDVAMETIHRLRELGYKVHIDDFGTGYSSLSYLQDLSVDAIKIDRSFTQSIGTGAVTMAILPQILAMAQALDLAVIAEGVETDQQGRYFAAAKQQRVFAQGWFFGRPVSAQGFCRALAENEQKTASFEVKREPEMANVA